MSEEPKHPEEDAAAEVEPAADAAGGGTPADGMLAELPDEAVVRLESELDAVKDRHLRLAAEYDNFRRRTGRERAELTVRAQADLVVRLIDALDDLSRFAHVDPATTDAATLHDGIDLVERKFWKQLNAMGLVRIDATGEPFDPAIHEAVTTAPAPEAGQDNTVGMVLQPGYRLGELLIRPARVLVLTWADSPATDSDLG